MQVLLTSEALDITARRCLRSPYPSKADLTAFTQLLSAVLPPTAQQPAIKAFAAAILDLTKVLPTGSNASALTSAAQDAVKSILACLKEAQPAAESASSAQSVSSDVPERAAALSDEIYGLQSKLSQVAGWR